MPRLSLEAEIRAELLGYCHEHLGGILLHRDEPRRAADAYHRAEVAFSALMRNNAIGDRHLLGQWKHRQIAAAMGEANSLAAAGDSNEAIQLADLVLAELRQLNNEAKQGPRNFTYRGNQFRTVLGEAQRNCGDILTNLGRKREALDALRDSYDILDEQDVAEQDANNVAATVYKQSMARAIFAHQLQQALEALDHIDRRRDKRKEYGVYGTFVERARAAVYYSLGEMQLAASHADKALRRAKACGLWRQERRMTQFLYQLDRRKGSDAVKK